MKTIKVSLADRSYPILISDSFSSLKKEIKTDIQNTFIITNKTIEKIYLPRLAKEIGLPLANIISIPDGEQYKTLATVEKIYHQLLKKQANRKSTLIALGGGVVGDITGFVAATFLRGIDFIQIPTTLLAMVDSSVGGKTGVDLPEGKNLIGAFYQPQLVLIATDFLKTLPKREYLCGLSEVVKYGLLWDEKFFDFLEKNTKAILEQKPSLLEKIIARCCEIKAHIVSEDEKEAGLRSLLNLGHTLGHAIEALTGFSKILHGEAVSQGMVYAARLSVQKSLISESDFARIVALLTKLDLPTQWPHFPAKKYQEKMASDKKSTGKKINYILLKKIGRATIEPLTLFEITKEIGYKI